MRVQGWDVSPNHSACVELEFGADFIPHLRWWAVATGSKTTAKDYPESTLLPDLPKVGKHLKSCDRVMRLRTAFEMWALRKPDLAALEDYAVGAARGAHYAGEIGGLARSALLVCAVPFRLLPIKGTKKAVAGHGAADKAAIATAVASYGIKFPELDAQSLEDLHDAASIALVCLFEQQLRAGRSMPRHVLEVLKSKSKANPLPLVDRTPITPLALKACMSHSGRNGQAAGARKTASDRVARRRTPAG